METLVGYQRNFLSSYGDPRVRHWNLLSDESPVLLVIIAYLIMVLLILPAYMKNRKPYDLSPIIKCYNIFQVLSNIIVLHEFLMSGWIQGDYSLGCQMIDYSDNPRALRLLKAFHWMYLLKIVELVETAFFVLRKKFKQVSALHVYHHASTVMLSFFACKFYGGGMFSIPIMLNLFIHILMYSYYYLSSLGKEWQQRLAPWKPKLTMAQMIQFVVIIAHGIIGMMPSCNVPKTFPLLYMSDVALLYKMFSDFYISNYKKKSVSNVEMNGHHLKIS